MTPNTLPDRLFRREIVGISKPTSLKGLYGHHKWVSDLDITNELGGHSGCVNALSWAKSGRLLASGSDDMYLNIHTYLPDDDCNPFKLTTTISTGHSANIFSVKFMPHSNDRTLVTCAGDSEIRVFDLEYSSRSYLGSSTTADTGIMRNGTRFMSQGDTNAKVYRSHSDRVKRIVTESSPHLFLSCSEDGEVRQWDLRQPSSYYPRPRGSMFGRLSQPDDPNIPPPLITYKRYGIDLNTISCSPSQPHYIALGGAHLHAFLHDRRMMGRDLFDERGAPASRDQVREATQCVRRFAPRGQKRMNSSSNGHITACKISDAHPNNMIVSWSGDCIYSFDLIRDPDAGDTEPAQNQRQPRVSQKQNSSTTPTLKKRRRVIDSPVSSEAAARASPRPRTGQTTDDDHFLAVNYGNGQSELIPLRDRPQMTESQLKAQSAGEAAAQIVKLMFQVRVGSLDETDDHISGYDFTPVLHTAASCIDDIDDMIRTWKYPVNIRDPGMILETEARRVRDATRRFVQCAGMLARLLGAQTPEQIEPRTMAKFASITAAPNESRPQSPDEHHALFCLDFIKAIGLWLGSGPGALIQGFTARPNTNASLRNPIHPDSGIEAIDEVLIPHLLERARLHQSVPDTDASRFEVDKNLTLFESEREAVVAFQRALQVPFADLSDIGSLQPGDAQDRQDAIRFWAFKVARGLLKSAHLIHPRSNITTAFGGNNQDDRTPGLSQDEEESSNQPGDQDTAPGLTRADNYALNATQHTDSESEENELRSMMGHSDYSSEEDEEEDEEDSESDSSSLSSSTSEVEQVSRRIYMAARERAARRSRVQQHTPCHAAVRSYRGHLNVATVKDVNFFGLNDEYVVSGSDSGHVMIWDTATTQLLNILEGDGEIVNVVQGHPHEPLLAVSGIDDTIKIFSPDARARRDAWYGRGVEHSIDIHARRPARRMGPLMFFDGESSDDENDNHEDDAENDDWQTDAFAAEHGSMSSEESADDDHNVNDSQPADGKAKAPRPGSTQPASTTHGLRQGRRLRSCRRMQNSAGIVRGNEQRSLQGTREAFVTRDALAMLAMRLRHVDADEAPPGRQGSEVLEIPDPRMMPADDCAVQ